MTSDKISDIKIPIILLEDFVSLGINHVYYEWQPRRVPHLLVCGSSGSGKSYLSINILAKICRYVPDAEIFICDFKSDDSFDFLGDLYLKNFYRFRDCYRGIEELYQRFQARQNRNDTSKNALFCFFDELPSFLLTLSKKEAEEAKTWLSYLLMMGRSYSIFMIIGLQRADASNFLAGSRDNIGLIISLGNNSKESIHMLFHSFIDQITPDRRRGTGYMLESGSCLYKVISPTIRDISKVHQEIINRLTAQGGRRQSLRADQSR